MSCGLIRFLLRIKLMIVRGVKWNCYNMCIFCQFFDECVEEYKREHK